MIRLEWLARSFHRFLLIQILVSLSVSSIAVVVYASNEGPPIEITVAEYDQQNPHVVALPDKNLWFVVWEDWRTVANPVDTNTGADIWGQFIDGDGNFCGEPVLISDEDNDGKGDPGNQTFPRVAYDQGDSRLGVVWQDTRGRGVFFRAIDVSDCSSLQFSSELEFSYNPVFGDSLLLGRAKPKIVYDPVRDQFWVAWTENRSARKRVTGNPFGCSANAFSWTVGDTSMVSFAALSSPASGNISEVVPPDVIRTDDNINVREISHSVACTTEIITYEFFDSVNNVDIAVDQSSGDILLAWEGVRRKLVVTNNSDEIENSPTDCFDCGADGVSSEAEISSFDGDPNVANIYGIHMNEVPLSEIMAMRLSDADNLAYNPSVMADPVSGKYLVAWEDLRGGANYTKIYGQLVYTTGNKYNTNFIIGYQDTNSDGELDEIVKNSRQTNPYVGYDYTNQRFFVAWQDGRNGSVSVENLDIFGQYVDGEGSLRGSNYLLSVSSNGIPAAGNQYSPAIAFNQSNHMFLGVWKDARNYATTRSDIYGQRFTIGQPQLTVLHMDNSLLSPSLIDFGSRLSGETTSSSFKIKNTGDIMLSVQNLSSLTSPFAYVGLPDEMQDGDTTGIDLMPGGEFTVTVSFTPTAAGSFHDDILITSNAGEVTINLQGLGLQQNPSTSSVSVNPSAVSFGSVAVGDAVYQSVVLQNDGNTAVNLVEVEEPSEPFTVLGGPSSGQKIDAGTSVNFVVKFAPTKGGSNNSRLAFIFKETNPVIIQLSGTGSESTDPPSISLSTSSVGFGEVTTGSSKSVNIKISNNGGQTAKILHIDAPSDGFTYSNVSSGTEIEPGNSVRMVITFSPQTASEYSGTFDILFSHLTNPLHIAVKGTGQDPSTASGPPDIVLSDSSISFADTAVGNTRSEHFTITNDGKGAATLLQVDLWGDSFTVDGLDQGMTIEPGQTIHAVIGFKPASEGSASGELRLLFNHLMDPMVVYLEGTGVNEEDYTPAGDETTASGQTPPWLNPSLQPPEVLVWQDSAGGAKWKITSNDFTSYTANRYLIVVTPFIDPWTGGWLFFSRRADGSFVKGLYPEAANWSITTWSDSVGSLDDVIPDGYKGAGKYYLIFGIIMPDNIHAYYDWISWTR